MTPKERVIKAISHQETDFVPYTVDLYQEAYQKMVRFYNDPDFLKKLGNHILMTCARGFPREKQVDEHIWQDAFGTQWDRSMDKGVGVIVSPLFTEDTFDEYEFPDPCNPKLYANFPGFIEENSDKFLIASVHMSYFERSWATYGFENVLVDMMSNESFIFRLYERILDYNLKLIDKYLEFDIDCIHINDDYGQQHGLIMGPGLWRKFIKPGLKAMSERIKSGGKYVYLHSCGDIREIISDLIDVGIDILNPFQPESMDVFEIKKDFGKYITFHGGISEQKTLNFGTPDDVEREMKEKIAKLGQGGGYILASSQGMTRNVPEENIDRFIKVAINQQDTGCRKF